MEEGGQDKVVKMKGGRIKKEWMEEERRKEERKEAKE